MAKIRNVKNGLEYEVSGEKLATIKGNKLTAPLFSVVSGKDSTPKELLTKSKPKTEQDGTGNK